MANRKELTLVPAINNTSRIRSLLRLIHTYFGIRLQDIWDCETLKEFKKLIKKSYFAEAKKLHPDLRCGNPITYKGSNAYIDNKLASNHGKNRIHRLTEVYQEVDKLNESDFRTILGLKSVPDPELPFMYTWDRDIHLPDGYHEDQDRLKYR